MRHVQSPLCGRPLGPVFRRIRKRFLRRLRFRLKTTAAVRFRLNTCHETGLSSELPLCRRLRAGQMLDSIVRCYKAGLCCRLPARLDVGSYRDAVGGR